jgi:hypothetical protein
MRMFWTYRIVEASLKQVEVGLREPGFSGLYSTFAISSRTRVMSRHNR